MIKTIIAEFDSARIEDKIEQDILLFLLQEELKRLMTIIGKATVAFREESTKLRTTKNMFEYLSLLRENRIMREQSPAVETPILGVSKMIIPLLEQVKKQAQQAGLKLMPTEPGEGEFNAQFPTFQI